VAGLLAGGVTRPGASLERDATIDPVRRDGTEQIIEGEWSTAEDAA
jgi:hypothetical protein